MANSDGSGTCMLAVAQDAITHNGGQRLGAFYGTAFGVRYLVAATQGFATGFSVDINGVRYEVRHKPIPSLASTCPSTSNSSLDVPDILPDHKHMAGVQTPGPMYVFNPNHWFTGIIIEHRPI